MLVAQAPRISDPRVALSEGGPTPPDGRVLAETAWSFVCSITVIVKVVGIVKMTVSFRRRQEMFDYYCPASDCAADEELWRRAIVRPSTRAPVRPVR